MQGGDCVTTDCETLRWQKHQNPWIDAKIKFDELIYTPVNSAEKQPRI